MIPKIIWQTHNYKHDYLPIHISKIANTWKNLNPGWEYRYFDYEQRQQFVKDECPEIFESYKKIWQPMYEADIWRYLIVHKYGGVYADMDSLCVKPLDYMLESYNGEDLIRSRQWQSWPAWDYGLVNNANFAAVKESKTLKKIIDFLLLNQSNGLEAITWVAFSKEAKKLKGLIFDAEFHAQEFKHNFYDYEINYYGQFMKYSHFLTKHSGLTEERIFKKLTR